MIKVSPSSLNIFLECPRCFWLYLNKNLKRPSIPVASITTGMDRVIKESCDQYRQKGALPPFLQNKIPGKLIKDFPKKGWLSFNDSQTQASFGGYLDECLDLGGNFYAALDHKTRGSKAESAHPAHQFQMDAYTFLLEENGFPTKRLAYLVYYIPRAVVSDKAIDFEIVASELKTDPARARKVFSDALALLKQPIPAARPGCIFCQWTDTANIK